MRKIGIFLFLSLLFTSIAQASYITLDTTLTSKLVNDKLEILVKTINKGDEPAYNVQAELNVAGKRVLARQENELGVNGVYSARVKLPVNFDLPGSYPLILTMHYRDANQYPFSALSSQVIAYKEKALPLSLFASLKSATFWQKGEVQLKVKNLASSAVKLKSSLVVPRELSVVTVPKIINLKDKSSQQVVFELENFSALDGSAYQVFAVLEYDQAGRHFTIIVPGTAKIVRQKNILGFNYGIIFAMLGLLVIVFLAAQFFQKK